tara:strand:- start:2776 stop:3600 length:825 start_codon:yes stop_codon:yes gene_type:complete
MQYSKQHQLRRKLPLIDLKRTTLESQEIGRQTAPSSRSKDLENQISDAVDERIVENNKKIPKRNYIGASSIGEECSRKIQYRFMNYPSDPEKEFTAKTLRIFQFGHEIEDYAAKWLRDAEFDLKTEDKSGKQFGFAIADDQIKGHIDGVLVSGPVPMKYPALWENKSANDRKFKEFVKHGVAKTNKVYATQIALYQAYMDLAENDCLFTVVNKNTSEIYYELVPFDKKLAQEASDKAVDILTSIKANDILPRIAQSRDFFLCKFCEYQNSCWGE